MMIQIEDLEDLANKRAEWSAHTWTAQDDLGIWRSGLTARRAAPLKRVRVMWRAGDVARILVEGRGARDIPREEIEAAFLAELEAP